MAVRGKCQLTANMYQQLGLAAYHRPAQLTSSQSCIATSLFQDPPTGWCVDTSWHCRMQMQKRMGRSKVTPRETDNRTHLPLHPMKLSPLLSLPPSQTPTRSIAAATPATDKEAETTGEADKADKTDTGEGHKRVDMESRSTSTCGIETVATRVSDVDAPAAESREANFEKKGPRSGLQRWTACAEKTPTSTESVARNVLQPVEPVKPAAPLKPAEPRCAHGQRGAPKTSKRLLQPTCHTSDRRMKRKGSLGTIILLGRQTGKKKE